MAIKIIVLIIIAFGGGIAVGTAIAAFVTILEIVPRLSQVTETKEKIGVYQWVMIISFVFSIIIYFSSLHLNLHKFFIINIGFIYGVFIGVLSSALAEVLNVIPILAKKLKIKDNLKYVVWALMGGKVVGALYYWILFK